VNGTLVVLVAAKECGVRKVVYASPGIRRHAEPAGESGKNSLSKLQIQEIRKKSL
jgi:hypothetical protein